jgi:hypothetical protein
MRTTQKVDSTDLWKAVIYGGGCIALIIAIGVMMTRNPAPPPAISTEKTQFAPPPSSSGFGAGQTANTQPDPYHSRPPYSGGFGSSSAPTQRPAAPSSQWSTRSTQPQQLVQQPGHPKEPGAGTNFDRQVQDYNNLLRRAQDATRNYVACDRQRDECMRLLAGSGDPASLEAEMKTYWDKGIQSRGEQSTSLRQALLLARALKSSPQFATYYQETTICLTYDQLVPASRELAADQLRFIERR